MYDFPLDTLTADQAWGGFGLAGAGARDLFYRLMGNEQVVKALQANDLLPKTGPGITALGVEDLTPVLASAEVSERQLYLWKGLPKAPAHDLIIQGARLDRANGNPGSTGFIGRNSAGTANDPSFTRYSQEIKFMAQKIIVDFPTQLLRQVTFTGVQDGGAMALAELISTRLLLKLAERNLAYADSTVCADEFDGAIKQIDDAADGDNMIRWDMRGEAPDKDFLENIQEIMLQNSGSGTDIHIPNPVRRDLRQALFGEQWATEGYAGTVGARFDQYMAETLGGDEDSVKIHRNQMMTLGVPDSLPLNVPTVASVNGPAAPLSVSVSAASHTATTYEPGMPGGDTFYYSVAAVNSEGGRSLATASSGAAPTAGQKVVVTVNCTDPNAQYFEVYRNASGTSGVSATGRKFVCRIKRTGNTTVWNDTNYYMPGTSHALFLSQRMEELRIRQLLPLLKRQLPQGLMDNSAGLLLFFALEMPVPTHHIHIANIGQRVQSGIPSLAI